MPRLPPHEKTAKYIHFRCHVNPTSTDYGEFFSSLFSNYLVAYETHSERPHFHALIETKGIRSLQFSKMIAGQFNLFGNADFMVKNVAPTDDDYNAVLQYICKGDDKFTPPNILFKTPNYTEIIIQQAHDLFHAKRIETYFPTVVSTEPSELQKFIKTKPTKAPTWTQKVMLELENTYALKKWDYNDIDDIKLMNRIVLEFLGERGKEFDSHKVWRIVLGLLNFVGAKNLRESVELDVLQFWRNRGQQC